MEFYKKKLPKLISKYIDKLINLVLVLMLLIGFYFIYDAWYIFYNDKANMAEYNPKEEGVEKLRELGDAVGWVYIEDTKLDFPIMQGKDNVEYLNKAPDGSYDLSGSIFLDFRNKPDFTDSYSLIYGHHMKGAMFGCIDDFMEEEYFNNHLKGTLWLRSGEELEIELFAFTLCDSNDDEIFDCENEYDRMAFLKENAEYYKEPKNDSIIFFSTCKQPNTTSRMGLAANILGIRK